MPHAKAIILGPTPPPYGGVAVFVSALYRSARSRGVKLWTFSDEQTKDDRVRYLKPFRLELLPSLIRDAFKARVIDNSYFAIEYPHKIFVPLWILGNLLLRFEWVKVFLDGSLPFRYPGFGRIQRLLFHSAIKSVTEFVVVNEELKLWLLNEIGVRQNVTIIPCLLPMSATLDTSLPEHLDRAIARHAKQVCSIGIFIPAYGFKEAAEAVARIRAESGDDIGLILIDGAYNNDDSYRRQVLEGRDWITVMTKLPRPLVLQVLKRSNVFVRPFGLESYGISRVEALWCGVPVVATRAGETRGMFLYDYGDQNGLIRQMKAALLNSNQQEILHWSAVFQKEAEENLRDLIKMIGIEV